MFRMGTKIQTVLTAAIYRKSLRLSNNARRQRTVGEITNLMAIDVERFQMISECGGEGTFVVVKAIKN